MVGGVGSAALLLCLGPVNRDLTAAQRARNASVPPVQLRSVWRRQTASPLDWLEGTEFDRTPVCVAGVGDHRDNQRGLPFPPLYTAVNVSLPFSTAFTAFTAPHCVPPRSTSFTAFTASTAPQRTGSAPHCAQQPWYYYGWDKQFGF